MSNFKKKLSRTFKGETVVGKILDGALEIAPIPNPIRLRREAQRNEILQKVLTDPVVSNVARGKGIDVSDMVEDGPKYLMPITASITFIMLVYLFATGKVQYESVEALFQFFSNFL